MVFLLFQSIKKERACKKFVTRESNPGQVDGNDLCYHYTSDEWMKMEGEFVYI